ncbi:hypothetical protein R2359_26400 [Mycobacteroides chelonae]|jgi:hypothetical protein|nr:hypothetical protein [Mycobacteroides chelonae]MEC4847486.1 hypothetical protein [Mycobacteroides chelonae]
MDWAKVAPTAAVVSAVVTLLIRWWDKPRPVLHLEMRLRENIGEASFDWGVAALINLGDGDAFDIRLFGSGCDVGVRNTPDNEGKWTYRIPVLKAGATQLIAIGTEKGKQMEKGDAIIVTWAPRSRRWFRRTMRIDVAELTGEHLLPPGVLEYVKIPWWVRRTSSLERKTPRAQEYLYPMRRFSQDRKGK